MRWPTNGPTSYYTLPPDRSDPPGNQASQGPQTQSAISGPALEKPLLDLGAVSAAYSSPVARYPEAGCPLSGEQNDLAPQTRAVGSTHVGSRLELVDLPENVLNTISRARASSTRHLYAFKWSVFSAWCATRGENPISCDISVILSYLARTT